MWVIYQANVHHFTPPSDICRGCTGVFKAAIFISTHPPTTTHITTPNHVFRQLWGLWWVFYAGFCAIFVSKYTSISKWGEGGVTCGIFIDFQHIRQLWGIFTVFLCVFCAIFIVDFQMGGSGGNLVRFSRFDNYGG